MKRHDTHSRKGAMVPLMAILIIPLLGMVAFAIDYGYLVTERAELQRAADAAALAAARDLVPDDWGNQDLTLVRATARNYVNFNSNDGNLTVSDQDIEIGRYDKATIYTNVTLLQDGTLDTVRITLRRDGNTNAAVPLFFARMIGVDTASLTVTATAVLQQPNALEAGSDVLPFAMPRSEWESHSAGDTWSIYGDGRITDDTGTAVPGNWGTVDIGAEGNSTNALGDQILDGLTQADLNALFNDGRISQSEYIPHNEQVWVNADTGLSGGLQHSVAYVHGESRLVPIYDTMQAGSGENVEFRVVAWGVVTVVDSRFAGTNNTYVTIRKGYYYDDDLRPQPDLSSTDVIEAAYTYPTLVD